MEQKKILQETNVFINFFKNRIWLYYLIQAVLFGAAITCTVLMPAAYIDWIMPKVFPMLATLILSFFALGFMLGDTKRSLRDALIEGGVFGFVFGGMYMYLHAFLTLLFDVDIYYVMTIVECALMIALLIGNVLLAVRSAKDVFRFQGKGQEIVAVVTLSVMLACMVIPFCADYFKTALHAYEFSAEPSVFVGSDTYSVIFATNAPGTASLVVEKDGKTQTFTIEKNGVELYDKKVHRIDVPKTTLDNATYYVRSTQTNSGTGHFYNMGKTIESKRYKFKPYSGTGDVSFMTISDNQGTIEPTVKAVKEAAKNNEYDFVFMLGDHAELYNDLDKDVIASFLQVAAVASQGEKPVYYTLGNHEYRGMLLSDVWDLIPTPSANGEMYYTFTMGDAYFTVLNYGVDHDDDYQRKYDGIAHCNEYKDKEYTWLQNVMAEKPYEGYTYNICISHIALMVEQNDNKDVDDFEMIFEHECSECKKIHSYKYKEFADLLDNNGVQYVISGHTHKKPKLLSVDGYNFKTLNTGSHYNNKTAFRNTIVTLKDGEFSYKVYGE